MGIDIDISKRLGYGGSAEISPASAPAVQVLITGGGFEMSQSPAYNSMVNIYPPVGSATSDSRSKVLHADGVREYTASLNFDVTTAIMALLTKDALLSRGYQFDIGIHDGNNHWTMSECRATQITLSGAPGGLITCVLSATGLAAWDSGPTVVNDFIRNSDVPLGYWWSGGADIRDWNFVMSQAVTSVYQNKNTPEPRYLKIGEIEYMLTVNLYNDHGYDDKTIQVASETFQLTGITTGHGYSFNGITDLGTYSHTFTSAAGPNGSNSVIIQ
jgi:hypothetical protein